MKGPSPAKVSFRSVASTAWEKVLNSPEPCICSRTSAPLAVASLAVASLAVASPIFSSTPSSITAPPVAPAAAPTTAPIGPPTTAPAAAPPRPPVAARSSVVPPHAARRNVAAPKAMLIAASLLSPKGCLSHPKTQRLPICSLSGCRLERVARLQKLSQYLITCRSCEDGIRARGPHRPDGSGPLASENGIQTVTVVVRRPREGV